MPTYVRTGYKAFPIIISILIRAAHGVRYAGHSFQMRNLRGEETGLEPTSV